MNNELFKRDPRSYALEMVDEGLLDARTLAHALLMYMSHDDVRDALDTNELSPRFDEECNHNPGRLNDDGTSTCVECGEDIPSEVA